MIQRPYTLANLPVSLHASQGKIFAADVHTVAGTKKRKRSELAVAVDYEGINIYDIRSSRLVTSYSVSPQSSFTCPPSSVRRRPSGPDAALRLTYCSVKDPKPRIQCFAETYETVSQRGSQVSTKTLVIKGSSSPVVHLEALDETHNEEQLGNTGVLVVHEDGEVRWLSQNLEKEEWKAMASPEPSKRGTAPKAQVEHTMVLDLKQAQNGILKNREDVLAMLGAGGGVATNEGDLKLLLLITRNQVAEERGANEVLHLRVFRLRLAKTTRGAVPTTNAKSLQELMSSALPEPSNFRDQASKSLFAFHPASGSLHQSSDSAIADYDLTGSSPRLSHYMQPGPDFITSCLRLSNSSVLTTSSTSISVLDMRYRSVQDSLSLHPQSEHPNNLPEPALTSNREAGNTHLLSYYAPLNLAVAVRGRKLIAYNVDAPESHSSGTKKRKRGGLLADSIGRGIKSTRPSYPQASATSNVPKALGSYLPSSRILEEQWESLRAKMDRSAAQGNVEDFEALMASQPVFSETVSAERDYLDPFAVPKKTVTTDRRIILYLLSKIFTLDRDTLAIPREEGDFHPKLRVSFLPARLFRWLVKSGDFTAQQVEASLKHGGFMLRTDRLPDGAFVQALVDFDTSLKTLLVMLKDLAYVDLPELIHPMRLVVGILHTSGVPDETKLITSGENEVESGSDEAMQITTITAVEDADMADDRSTSQALFELCLTRLNAFHDSQVSRALRQHFSKDELISLVHCLRMELARSGWLSHYIDDDFAHVPAEDQANDQLCVIAKMLNCVIDAIGSGGWITANATADDFMETEDTITYMKFEISAALEGIEEATYMKGLLGEMLLFGKSLGTQPKPPKVPDASPTSHMVKPITIPLGGLEGNFLPLGLKAPQGVSQTKVGAGGEVQKRSKRDTGRLKSKKVGKYSFERIVL
ncbi:hypothetical protein MMC08_005833 [Hypocenomyce scalaris]|nr:hypothetical protein [Hypocenomyce scalaris]